MNLRTGALGWISVTATALMLSAGATARATPLDQLALPFVDNRASDRSPVAFWVETHAGPVSVLRDGSLQYGGELRERLLGHAVLAPGAPSPTRVSRFLGSDPQRWQRDLPTVAAVRLGQPWPGVEVEVVARGKNLEKIFTVHPHARVGAIALELDRPARLQADGTLRAGALAFSRPIAYQIIDGQRRPVEVRYRARGKRYGFVLGRYDRRHPVVIDPIIQATYFGHSSHETGVIGSVRHTNGDLYLFGETRATSLPSLDGFDTTRDNRDCYVTRIAADLKSIKRSTYFGGGFIELCQAIAEGPGGDLFIGGSTDSDDLPGVTAAAGGAADGYQKAKSSNLVSNYDNFVARLSTDLSDLVQSTYLGGTDSFDERIFAIAATSDDVYVVGTDPSFALDGFDKTTGTNKSFVAQLGGALTTLKHASGIGGGNNALGSPLGTGVTGIAYNSGTKAVYVIGYTGDTNFPGTSGKAGATAGTGQNDGYVAKFSDDLSTMTASYISGNGAEPAAGIALAANGDVLVVGSTASSDLLGRAGGAQASNASSTSMGYVIRFNADLTTAQSTYTPNITGQAIAIDNASGDVFTAGGVTAAGNPPNLVGGIQTTLQGGNDAGVLRLNGSLTSFLQSTLYGGDGLETANGIHVDSANKRLYIVGTTDSTNLPGTSGGGVASDPWTTGSKKDAYAALLSLDLLAISPPPEGLLQLASATYSVSEGAGTLTITVTRTGGSSGAVSVTIASAGVTATAGSDYTTVNQSVMFNDGESGSKTIEVTILEDDAAESSETFTVTLSAPQGGAALGATSTTTVTITDNDSVATADLSELFDLTPGGADAGTAADLTTAPASDASAAPDLPTGDQASSVDGGGTQSAPDLISGGDGGKPSSGCGCQGEPGDPAPWGLVLAVALLLRRRAQTPAN